jgi:hypothetical protein
MVLSSPGAQLPAAWVFAAALAGLVALILNPPAGNVVQMARP